MQSANNLELTSVKFQFKKVGPIKEAEMELGDLTIIAGRNNTGKTYLAYTLYGFLKMWKEWGNVEDLKHKERLAKNVIKRGQYKWVIDRKTLNEERNKEIQAFTRSFSKRGLTQIFSSSRVAFEDASIDVELSGEFPQNHQLERNTGSNGILSIQYNGTSITMTIRKVETQPRHLHNVIEDISYLYRQFLFPELSHDAFVLSSERFGISLFYKELDFTKNQLVDLLQKMGDHENRNRYSPFLIIDGTTSRYALPIKDNIDFTRSIYGFRTKKSEIYENKLFDDIKDMMGGYYRSSGDDIEFRSRARGKRRFNIPLHIASSSARGLSDLYFYLRHVAKKNHLLIIDEPESHLDTANQIQLARLLARFIQAGLKVLITTHSDYLIKEINNLIMLSKLFDNKEEVVKNLGYKKDDLLEPNSVQAYVAEEDGLSKCEVDDFGIDMPVFDETIDKINRVSNELASRLAAEDGQT